MGIGLGDYYPDYPENSSTSRSSTVLSYIYHLPYVFSYDVDNGEFVVYKLQNFIQLRLLQVLNLIVYTKTV